MRRDGDKPQFDCIEPETLILKSLTRIQSKIVLGEKLISHP